MDKFKLDIDNSPKKKEAAYNKHHKRFKNYNGWFEGDGGLYYKITKENCCLCLICKDTGKAPSHELGICPYCYVGYTKWLEFSKGS